MNSMNPIHVCAHRGASRTHPENTAAAFDEAVRVGAPMLEFDVRRTRDGECVIMHDARVDRTTDGQGAVRELTWREIRALDAGAGERVPHLDEALAYADRARLNVQIKVAEDDDAESEAYAEALAKAFADEAVRRAGFITASNAPFLQRMREGLPDVQLCKLGGRGRPDYPHLAASPPAGQIIQPRAAETTSELVAAAHELGLEVNVYFADDEATASRLLDCGVDGILTNDPAWLIEWLAARRGGR